MASSRRASWRGAGSALSGERESPAETHATTPAAAPAENVPPKRTQRGRTSVTNFSNFILQYYFATRLLCYSHTRVHLVQARPAAQLVGARRVDGLLKYYCTTKSYYCIINRLLLYCYTTILVHLPLLGWSGCATRGGAASGAVLGLTARTNGRRRS